MLCYVTRRSLSRSLEHARTAKAAQPLMQRVLKPHHAQRVPHAWPHPDPCADLAEGGGGLVDVDRDSVLGVELGEGDGEREPGGAAAAVQACREQESTSEWG